MHRARAELGTLSAASTVHRNNSGSMFKSDEPHVGSSNPLSPYTDFYVCLGKGMILTGIDWACTGGIEPLRHESIFYCFSIQACARQAVIYLWCFRSTKAEGHADTYSDCS